MKKKVLPALPKGFTAIRGGGDFAPSWDFRTTRTVTGTLVHTKEVHQDKRGKMKARDTNVYTVKTADGDIAVWESAGLRALQQVKKGQRVHIVYLGKKRIKGQSNPMHDFIVGVAK